MFLQVSISTWSWKNISQTYKWEHFLFRSEGRPDDLLPEGQWYMISKTWEVLPQSDLYPGELELAIIWCYFLEKHKKIYTLRKKCISQITCLDIFLKVHKGREHAWLCSLFNPLYLVKDLTYSTSIC